MVDVNRNGNINYNYINSKINMQSIKYLKKDYIQLGNLIYKPYKICSLPANFGCIEFNEKEGVSEWFNYKGYTYILETIAK